MTPGSSTTPPAASEAPSPGIRAFRPLEAWVFITQAFALGFYGNPRVHKKKSAFVMSGSGSSNTWSGSVDFSDISSSSSWHCPAPRRLMNRMAEQLRRMGCRNKQEEEAEITMCMINPHLNIHPQQLANMLRDRLERLNDESDEDDQPLERSPRKVAFLDDTPSCSSAVPVPNLLDEKIMEADSTLSSEAACQVPSTSADAAFGNFKDDDLGKIILGGQTSIFKVNFLDLSKFADTVTKVDVHGSQWTEHEEGVGSKKTANGKNKKIRTTNGEVKVYENGRVTISFGGNLYEMTKSARQVCDEEVVRVDQVEGTTSGIMTSLGPVQNYVVAVPQTEYEENFDDIETYSV